MMRSASRVLLLLNFGVLTLSGFVFDNHNLLQRHQPPQHPQQRLDQQHETSTTRLSARQNNKRNKDNAKASNKPFFLRKPSNAQKVQAADWVESSFASLEGGIMEEEELRFVKKRDKPQSAGAGAATGATAGAAAKDEQPNKSTTTTKSKRIPGQPLPVKDMLIAQEAGKFVTPITKGEVADDVSEEALKGAFLVGAAAAALAGKGAVLTAGCSLTAAYAALTSGTVGQVVRKVGNMAWDIGTGATDVYKGAREMGLQRAERAEIERQEELVRRALRAKQTKELNQRRLLQQRLALELKERQREAQERAEEERRLAEEKKRLNEETLQLQARLEEIARLKQETEEAEEKCKAEDAERERRAAEIQKVEEARQARLAKYARLRAKEEQAAEVARLAEEARLAEIRELERAERLKAEAEARAVEQARLKAEAEELARKRAEDEERMRVAEAERKAEEERLAEIARKQKEEAARLAEIARKQEEERLAEEARRAEAERLAQETRDALTEAERATAVAKQFFDDGDLLEFVADADDQDWEATIRAAQESIDGKVAGLDESLTTPDKSDGMDDAMAKAARAAVDAFEMRWDEDEDEDDDEDDDEFDEFKNKLSEASMDEEIRDEGTFYGTFKGQVEGGADTSAGGEEGGTWVDEDGYEYEYVWEEVDEEKEDEYARGFEEEEKGQSDQTSDDSESYFQQPNGAPPVATDWSSLTVAKLRAELKSRGLPTVGKKAVLVAALEQSDLELGNAGFTGDNNDVLIDQAFAAIQAAETFLDTGGNEPTDEDLRMIEDGVDGAGMADFELMTIPELKEELRARGLRLGGRKADLVARLQTYESE